MGAKQYLLFDENCPLCQWYTRIFVQFNFIESSTRISYQKAADNTGLVFDRERAKSEIALVREGEEALYGVDSMLSVIGSKWYLVGFIGRLFPVYWLLQLLYRFISFNRKIIAPTTCVSECSCTPKFNLFWRVVFIGFCGLMTYLFVGEFFNTSLKSYLLKGRFNLEFILFIGQLVFQSIAFTLLKQRGLATYLGHLAFISLIGSFFLGGTNFLIKAMIYFNFETGILAPFFFGSVVALMVYEHSRRVKLLGLTSWLTVTLILFRILIYPLVFSL